MTESELAALARVRRELSSDVGDDPRQLAEFCRRREEQLQREGLFPRFSAGAANGRDGSETDAVQPTSPKSSTRP